MQRLVIIKLRNFGAELSVGTIAVALHTFERIKSGSRPAGSLKTNDRRFINHVRALIRIQASLEDNNTLMLAVAPAITGFSFTKLDGSL